MNNLNFFTWKTEVFDLAKKQYAQGQLFPFVSYNSYLTKPKSYQALLMSLTSTGKVNLIKPPATNVFLNQIIIK